MEKRKKKCYFKDHKEVDSISYCQECKIYMCNKCINIHKGFFENHHQYILDKEINEIFTGICSEQNHYQRLEYFCKNHNQLCCAACIAKIKGEGNGQHTDCNVCFIKEIKKEKENNLKENIKSLENLYNTLEKSINELKIFFEKINKSKEELKLYIQNIFTKIRNSLNEREDELLLKVDDQFKEWNNNNKLNSLINDCLVIENNIKDINSINEMIKKCNPNDNFKIKFTPEENGINLFLETIKSFGNIFYDKYTFKNCPINAYEYKKYIVSGEKGTIIKKIGKNNWTGIICEHELDKFEEHKWKIKILQTQSRNIMMGVAPVDFDINSSSYNYGWYFHIDSYLYSGPPHNYSGNSANLKRVTDEILIIMNMKKKSLKFIINNEDKGDSYSNIPLEKPISPVVFLYNPNDSIEIIEC